MKIEFYHRRPKDFRRLFKRKAFVLYGQIFCRLKGSSTNDLTKVHISQGFAFRSECLTIIPEYQDGDVTLEVFSAKKPASFALAERAVLIPWVLNANQQLTIGTITHQWDFEKASATRSVLFELYDDAAGAKHIDICFCELGTDAPLVVRDDGTLPESENLSLSAEPHA